MSTYINVHAIIRNRCAICICLVISARPCSVLWARTRGCIYWRWRRGGTGPCSFRLARRRQSRRSSTCLTWRQRPERHCSGGGGPPAGRSRC
uniref:Uncharacterized protein n=1 Tax=Zea mays TaxID=4577 RepID=C0PL70_MAIZE|nr:unknown [Zea mays]